MQLKDFIKSLSDDADAAFAVECRTSLGHLRNVGYGLRVANPELCVSIERASNGAVTRQELRPEDWHRIWPELAEQAA